jgi:hypothetical protein
MVVDVSPQMMLWVLIILVICVFLIIAGIVSYVSGPGQGKKSGAKRPGVEFDLETRTAEPLEGGEAPAIPPGGSLAELQEETGVPRERIEPMKLKEIMRVLRDEDTGAIVVEVGGRRYRQLIEIRDGRIGNQVLEAIADLIKFTGGIITGQWAAASVTPAVPTREMPPQSQVVEPVSPPRAVDVEPTGSDEEEAFLRRLREGDLQVGETLPKEAQPSIMGYFTRRRKPQAAAEGTGAGGTFIDEIETILQRMISTAPTPPSEEVHVRTGPDGSLQIQVGGQYFSSADEVPNPAIRDLIKAAVKEWERS